MNDNTKAVTDKSFDTDVVAASNSGPVLVDFWAEWCGPCKMIGPALEEIAGDLAGKLTVAKVDIDDNPLSPGQVRRAGYPDAADFQGRQGRRDQGRRDAEGGTEAVDRKQPLSRG